jgi:hypothetical protein
MEETEAAGRRAFSLWLLVVADSGGVLILTGVQFQLQEEKGVGNRVIS